MAVNTMTVNQLSTVLNAIVNQARGAAGLSAVNTGDFVSVAKAGLEVGYDPLVTAISQVLSRTIFSNRPYNRKLRVLEADAMRYGNHARKLQVIDQPFVDDDRTKLVDGSSIDPWEVKKPSVYQTNFYGINQYEKFITIYKDQLNVAFTGPGEFNQFISMVMQNVQDQLEQAYEETARATLCNLIGGTASTGVATQQVHLVTEYNTEIGGTYTLAQLMEPDRFADFARWIFARIKTLSKSLENRSVIYHQNPTTATPVAGNISRHTPVEDQRLVLYEPFFNRVNANVLSVSFSDRYLKTIPYEGVTFWQNIGSPQSINISAGYTDTAGAVQTATFNNATVLGILFDRDAAGYTPVNQWQAASPLNPRGGYTNIFWHVSTRYWNDNSENAVVLLLD